MKSAPKLDIFCENSKKNFQILNIISIFAAKMAGLYIHIPFCRSRCIYCGFYSTTKLSLRQRYVEALCREMAIRSERTEESGARWEVGTVYLGGGTPSQLTHDQLQQLFDTIYYIYKVENDAEITVECNPDDVNTELASLLVGLGVNRVSMGAQTFNDERLRLLRRRHTGAQVPQAVDCLRKAGIDNISIDLIYGFPDETLYEWEQDIDSALSLNVTHLSAYNLMYEEGTALYELMSQGKLRANDEDTERLMYDTLTNRLTQAGYEHYEISNFARPGLRSRHNSSYWTDVPYLGLGAAAHSYDGKFRQWNIDDLDRYMEGIEKGLPIVEREELDAQIRYNDRVMLSLRTCEGLDLTQLTDSERQYCLSQARSYLADGQLCRQDDRLILTRCGLFVSDMVMSSLMQV